MHAKRTLPPLPVKHAALRCFAVAAPGLEPLVATELAALGITAREETGGASWEGDIGSVYQANLWLRTATRVLVRVARFRATSFWELERRAARIPWSAVVRAGATVAFRVTARKSKLYHSDAVAERLGASVTAAMRGVTLLRTSAAEDDEDEGNGPAQLFIVRLSRDELTLSADSSGEPLYRRGYRQAVAKAPLRETLAAAILLASEWAPGEPLLDPFCGSGTIVLEGGLLARRIAPGLAAAGRQPRPFRFTEWPGFSAETWNRCTDDARLMALPDGGRQTPSRIRGADRDTGAIAAARANAARAGLEDVVEFAVAPVSALVPPDGGTGLIATNPPYGVRVGEATAVRRLYAAFGRAVRERAAGWRLAMLSPDPRLDAIVASEAGLHLQERVRTRNGGIPVRIVAGGEA